MTTAARTLEPRRVVVAEDTLAMRVVMTRALTKDGYEVLQAEDGWQLQELLAQPDTPRLVITDWNMPGPSGVEICRELRARPGGEGFYVLIVTAYTEQDRLLEALEAGANDFLRKPFQVPELIARARSGQRVLDLQAGLETRVAELEAALAEVRTLRGLIPICSHCHRIHTDDDTWQKLESYLESHSEAVLSHGLCEECLEKYYPDPGDSEAV